MSHKTSHQLKVEGIWNAALAKQEEVAKRVHHELMTQPSIGETDNLRLGLLTTVLADETTEFRIDPSTLWMSTEFAKHIPAYHRAKIVDEFVKVFNQICLKAHAKLQEIQAPTREAEEQIKRISQLQ